MTGGNNDLQREQDTRTKKTQGSAGQEASEDLQKQLSRQLEEMNTPVGYDRPKWCGKNGVYWLSNTTQDNASFHRKFPNAGEGNQQSQCVFREDALRNMLKFSKSEAVPKVAPGTIVIKKSKTGGIGVFAGRDIKYGELILAERPLIAYPIIHPAHVDRWLKMSINLSNGESLDEMGEKLLCISAYETEMEMQKAFSEMTPENQRAYLDLANAHKEDGSGPLAGILRTNGFGIDSPVSGDHKTKYTVVGKEASRLNHSCCPNALFGFSLKSFSIQFHALKDIKQGEEIFCSYIRLQQSVVERQQMLSRYGFDCTCPACRSTTPGSDRDLLRESSEEEITRFRISVESNTDLNHWAHLLHCGLELERRLQADGLDVMEGPYYVLQKLIGQLYALLGDRDRYRKYQNACEIWERRSMVVRGYLTPANAVV